MGLFFRNPGKGGTVIINLTLTSLLLGTLGKGALGVSLEMKMGTKGVIRNENGCWLVGFTHRGHYKLDTDESAFENPGKEGTRGVIRNENGY